MLFSRKLVKFLVVPVLAILILVFNGTTYAQAIKDKSKTMKNITVAPTQKLPRGSKALSPQPEPPDKPAPGAKALGPQPEPPDMPDSGSRSLGPQPEPPDKGVRVK